MDKLARKKAILKKKSNILAFLDGISILNEEEIMKAYSDIQNRFSYLMDYWDKHEDLRFTQVLVNNGIIENKPGHWYYRNINRALVMAMVPPCDFLVWGSNGVDGKSDLEFNVISDLGTNHIKNILSTQVGLTDIYRKAFENELEKRCAKKS